MNQPSICSTVLLQQWTIMVKLHSVEMAGYMRRGYIKSLCRLSFNLLYCSIPGRKPRQGHTRSTSELFSNWYSAKRIYPSITQISRCDVVPGGSKKTTWRKKSASGNTECKGLKILHGAEATGKLKESLDRVLSASHFSPQLSPLHIEEPSSTWQLLHPPSHFICSSLYLLVTPLCPS